MMRLNIRKASVKDIPSIVRVRRTAFTAEEVQGFTSPEPSIFYYVKRMKAAWENDNRLKDGWRIYLAEANEVVEKDSGYIDNINISRDQQFKGVGKALVQHVEQVAKSEGASVMRTDTTENSKGVRWKSYAFWTRMGYKDTGERIPTEWSFKEIPFIKKIA
jgi:N-acetylglutamate synthase-like GNAT family acetyltransferase